MMDRSERVDHRKAGGLRGFVEGREEYVLALLLFLVASTTAVVLYFSDSHAFTFFGDAASHIVKARQIIDSQSPGIENIGTVWLPLPYFLLLPFVVSEALFFSGVAGPALGIPLLVGTGVLLFSIVRRLTSSRPIAFLSACVFGLNPNVVYMALTPMNELSLLFFVTLGGYALLRWLQEDRSRWLVLCAVAVALATLCRYEAWVLAGYVSLIAVIKGITLWKGRNRSAAGWMFAIAGASLAGIFLWLCWNRFEYGDALQFAPWKYRASPSAFHDPLQYRQEAPLLTYVRAVLDVLGPVALLVGAVGIIRFIRVAAERRHLILHLYFILPALFIFAGIATNLVLIDEWRLNWRFVLTLGLFLSVAGGVGLVGLFNRVRSSVARSIVAACLLAMPVVQLMLPSVGVATYQDAERIYHGATLDATKFGEQLRSTYKGGRVVLLTGHGLGQRVMLSSWIPLKNFRVIYHPGGMDILGPIRFHDRYVLIGRDRSPELKEAINYWLSRRRDFLLYYDIVLEDNHYILLKRKSAEATPQP